MSYTCRLYLNSGFNTVNIPDSPTLLDSLDYIDCDVLQILQNRNLPYIDVKVASYDAVKNVDYCRLDDWFYFVDNIVMLNTDTARLTTYADWITCAGGVSALKILDGITSRVHTGSDDYAEFTETDPYMAPSQTPKIVYQRAAGGGSATVVVKTTLNLVGMASLANAITYTDSDSGETVTIPVTILNENETQYQYEVGDTTASLGTESLTTLFDTSKSDVLAGLNRAQSIGVTGAITSQVALPSAYVVVTEYDTGLVQSVKGVDNEVDLTDLPYVYGTANNRKVFYSDYMPYGIISCSGDKAEYTAAEIYENSAGTGAPILRYMADPRVDGKPYFNYKYINGDSTYSTFFSRAVAGMQWKETPLVYEGASGSALKSLDYLQSRQSANLEYTQNYAKQQSSVRAKQIGLGAAGVGLAAVGAIATGGALGLPMASTAAGMISGSTVAGAAIAGAAGTVGGALLRGVDEWTGQADLDRMTAKYETEKAQELAQYMVNTSCYVPELNFVPDANLARDLLNNGAICYRYEYTDFDLARIDKILTMYGYKVTKALETSDFTSRQYFNYVEAGVSIGGLPRWFANGIREQLNNGVRIWHVLPDPARYDSNPIV